MIWNPHAFGPTGTPLGPKSPPELRVEGGVQPSALTLNLAQQVFAQFCTDARLSTVPNPTRAGKLPDGTPFRIVTVGPQTIMQIWPALDDDLRPSGIAITLEHVDGSVIDGHHTDGVRTLYLLTPMVKKGTRTSTGKWTVRKPQYLAGGKAVNASADGKFYYTGVRGGADISMPFFRAGGLGVNGVAYDDDEPGVNAPIYRHSSQLGTSRDNPLPWLYKKDGQAFGMQLQVRLEFEPTTRTFLDLYVGPPSPGAGPVGDLVDTYQVPAGHVIRADSITFSGDGTTARAIGSSASGVDFLRFDFTPTSVNMVIERTSSQSRVSGFRYNLSGRGETSGTPATVGYREQGWTIFGEGDSSTEYGSTTPINLSINGPVHPGTQRFDGEADLISYAPDSHLFNRRGKPDDDAPERPRGHMSGYADQYTSSAIIGEPTPGTFVIENHDTFTSRALNTWNGPAGAIVAYEESDVRNTHSVSTFISGSNGGGESLLWEVSGGGFSYQDSGGGPSPIFEDKELDFSAFYYTRNARTLTWKWIVGDGGQGYTRQFTSDVVETTSEFRVVCKGRTLLSFEVDLSEFYRCVAFLAADPMTGALLVNVQEVQTFSRVPRKSWLFLADDQGGKLLSDVMTDLPGGDDIKAVNNASIFSV